MAKTIINPKVKAEIENVLAQMDMPVGKAAKLLAKSFGRDAKLNRFLTENVNRGYSFFTDEKVRNRVMDTILQGFGFTNNVTEKRALIVKVLTAQVDSEVEAKRLEVTAKGQLDLTEEQKTALAKKLVEYKRFLTNDLQKATHEIALTLGVTEVVEEQAPVLQAQN